MKILERTHSTPEIDLEDSTLKFSGICTPENPHEFFNIVKEQVDKVLTSQKKYDLIFNLDYFNTSSSKCLLDLFRKVSKSDSRSNVNVVWMYESDDDEMKESGELYQELSGIDFEFKPFD